MVQAGQNLNDYLGDTCRLVGSRGDIAYGCGKLGMAVSADLSGMGHVRSQFFKAAWNIQTESGAPQLEQKQPTPSFTNTL